MFAHIIAVLIGFVVGIFLIQLFIRLWNQFNLDSRQYHNEMAAAYLDANEVGLAKYHLEKSSRAQKWFIHSPI